MILIHVYVYSLYSNSYLEFLRSSGCHENESHEKHKENMVEESSHGTNDEVSNSSTKTNDNITLQQNDKVLFNFPSILGLLVFSFLWVWEVIQNKYVVHKHF